MPTALRLHAPVILPCDAQCSVYRDAVIDVDETGRVVFCGPHAEAPGRPRDARVQECSGILLPGLINTHAHSPMTLLRGMGGDLPLLRWLREAIWPAEARLRHSDIRAGMELGSVEMLRAGVTTSAEMYFDGEAVGGAALAISARAGVAPAGMAAPHLNGRGAWPGMV